MSTAIALDDPELRAAERAEAELRRCMSDPYWAGRIAEAIARIADADAILSDYGDAAEGDAARLGVPEQRAAGIASEAFERDHLRAQEIVEALRKALRFCAPGCQDSCGRKVCERFGVDLAPQISGEALKGHFGAEAAAERFDRWQRLLAALAPARRAT